ncbi:DUF2127 domain-containing protein [soil metagenome]
MISQSASRRGVRIIAIIEAAKGVLALLFGCGTLALLHRDLGALALRVVTELHLNPAHNYPRLFIELSASATDGQLWLVSSLAFVYALFRLVESYGLMRERTWAEWLTFVSGTLYLPVEIYELSQKVTWIRVSILLINIGVVIFMGLLLWRSLRTKSASDRNKLPESSGFQDLV